MRPSRHQVFMQCAQAWATRATCQRLNVGAIVVSGGNIVSHGYNGAPAGHPHCLGNSCPGKLECHETVHAEMNALMRMPHNFRAEDLYCTDSPCPDCCSLIISFGVRRVFFSTPYRIEDGLWELIGNNVEIYRVLPAGYILRWPDKTLVEMDR